MATFPTPKPIVERIFAAYVAESENWDQFGINVGELGGECDRALYYSFHWASKLEKHTGNKLRRFATGNKEEERLIADLERAGEVVFGQQERIRFVAGHVRGKIDGHTTDLLCEFKATNENAFKAIHKDGCRDAKPTHFCQCQLGMHATGLRRALYLVANTNTDDLHEEIIEYDESYCDEMLARADKIVRAHQPPPKISDKPDFFVCAMCRHQAVCQYDAFPRVTCRSCIHSTPELGGDAHWSCSRWDKPLGFNEQKAACPTHLFDPVLVPGEQIDSDEEQETITYQLKNGSVWTDGHQA